MVDDGRRFLERSGEQYDVITIDPPPPIMAAGYDPMIVGSISCALHDSFPHVRVFVGLEGWGSHLSPIELAPPAVLAARMPASVVADLPEWGPATAAGSSAMFCPVESTRPWSKR